MRNTTQTQVLSILFFLMVLPLSYLSAQCTLVVNSADGYQVNIEIMPVKIVLMGGTCPTGGYNFNVELDHIISFTGTNIPSELYILQGTLDCGSHTNMFFPLPINGGAGTATSNANAFRNIPDCSTATPESLMCNSINLTVNGPGISTTSYSCIVNFSSSALPVELISFSGKSTDKGVELKWETASELDNDYFLLQRSDDGIVWSNIERIPGMGTTFIYSRYSYIDRSPIPGLGFYRLKQTDFDNQFELSNVVTVEHDVAGQVTLFPNPAKENITINRLESVKKLSVFNAVGKEIYIENQISVLSDEMAELNIENLPAGIYFLKTQKETLKFTKV